ncbi:MAG TPA: alpha/beta hydrolase [Acidimicrobiales bacterium]|jgi:pimeloyl-ACP methyl ester carboxylesterase
MRLVRSTDEVLVAVHDFGGNGSPMLLAHATGFCGQVMAPLAEHLKMDFRCLALDFRGHGGTRTPPSVDFQWTGLADDVIAAITGNVEGPVFAFGHSSGGAAVLMAEARCPGLFAGLVAFEPVLWPDPTAAVARAERLANGARRRRAGFPSREEAYENYASKPPFSWMDEQVLRAYVDHGLVEADDGTVTLACRPEVEARIYLQGAANDSFSSLADVDCPVVVARGTERGAIERPITEAQVGALPNGRLEDLDGLSHFGPLEDPSRAAAMVLRRFGP